MTRALAFKQKQVTAICKGAAKAGYVAVVRVGDVVIELVPANSVGTAPIDKDVSPEAFDTFEEYLAWRDGAGGAGEN